MFDEQVGIFKKMCAIHIIQGILTMFIMYGYPLVNVYMTMEHLHFQHGKSTISMGHFLCRYVTNYHTYNGLMPIPTIGVHSNYTWHTCLSQRSRCSYPVPASSLGTEDSKNMWWPVWRVRWNLPKFVILSSFIILPVKIRQEQIFPSCSWFTVIPLLLHWSYIPIVVPCCTPIVNGSLLVPSSNSA